MPDSLKGQDWGTPARAKEPEREVFVSAAAEPGRGRAANRPSEIPFRGWGDIFWRLLNSASEDRILATSGSVAFFALLAAFPAVATVVSLYGIFADAHTIDRHLMLLSGFLPASGIDLLGEEMKRIAGQSGNKLGLAFVIASAIALWSANSGMVALFDALNLVYKEREKRSLVRLYGLSLLFTLLAVALMAVAVGMVVVLPIFLNVFGLGTWNERDRLYGSLGAVVGFMTWMWFSVVVVLAGAELNAEMELQTSVDSTAGRPRPAGRRGAIVADTLGEAQD
jgi:membrane protein